MLSEIYIRVYKDEKRPFFHFYTGGVERMFLLHLGKLKISSVEIINLYFTNNEYKITDDYDSIINADIPFDFWVFEGKKTFFDKKCMILEALYFGISKLAAEFGWVMQPFNYSYDKCLEEGLDFNWFYKSKLFKSPNSKFHFGLWHKVDIGIYEIWEILYDHNKKEITRRRCFREDVCVFFVDYASWEGQNEQFFYRFNGPKKKFVAIVEDIISEKQISLSESSSSFFKKS